MRIFMRLCRAECVKIRHTILLPMHLLVPLTGSAIFLFYYQFNNRNMISQITGYMEVLGIVLPLLVSIICSRSAELEEGNHFQTFLGAMPHRCRIFLAKWVALQTLELGALIFAVAFFAAGYQILLGNVQIPAVYWFICVSVLWAGSIPLYPLHLYLNLKFSKTISMCVGVVELLVSSLFLTGLGDTVWQYVPCSWSARWVLIADACFRHSVNNVIFLGYLQRMAGIGLLITAIVCGIIFIWFLFYGGKQCDD